MAQRLLVVAIRGHCLRGELDRLVEPAERHCGRDRNPPSPRHHALGGPAWLLGPRGVELVGQQRAASRRQRVARRRQRVEMAAGHVGVLGAHDQIAHLVDVELIELQSVARIAERDA